MRIASDVNQILSSPVYVFDTLIAKLVGKNFYFAKIELSRYPFTVDVTLFESIKSILKDLEEEVGMLSHFLYLKFSIELCKNKKREQLLYLGSELKFQHQKIKSRLLELDKKKEHLSHSITSLKKLSKSFQSKDMLFESDQVKNKSNFYLAEVRHKVDKLERLELSLLMKYNDLIEIEKIYHKLLKTIPRHEKLLEETHLMLPLAT